MLNAAILTIVTLSDLGTRSAVGHPTVPNSWSGFALPTGRPCRVVLAPQGCLHDLRTDGRSIAIGDDDWPTALYRIFYRLPKHGAPI
jgi:hypothetical protein